MQINYIVDICLPPLSLSYGVVLGMGHNSRHLHKKFLFFHCFKKPQHVRIMPFLSPPFSFFSHFSSFFFQFLVNNVGVMYDYPQYFLDVPKQVTLNAPSFV